MKIEEFKTFLEIEDKARNDILTAKNDDYASGEDKLANFKQAAKMDGVTPVEALRGMWLKHRCSVQTGLNDLLAGKERPLGWWQEKIRDDMNYAILLLALITEDQLDEEYAKATHIDAGEVTKEAPPEMQSIEKGDIVEYLGASKIQDDYAGHYPSRMILDIGEKYTVENVDVHSWYTDIYLKEFPDKKFNSVVFKIIEQSKEAPKEVEKNCTNCRWERGDDFCEILEGGGSCDDEDKWEARK